MLFSVSGKDSHLTSYSSFCVMLDSFLWDQTVLSVGWGKPEENLLLFDFPNSKWNAQSSMISANSVAFAFAKEYWYTTLYLGNSTAEVHRGTFEIPNLFFSAEWKGRKAWLWIEPDFTLVVMARLWPHLGWKGAKNGVTQPLRASFEVCYLKTKRSQLSTLSFFNFTHVVHT